MEKNLGPTPPEAGKSSFDLVDFDRLASLLPLGEAREIADLGCGAGRYLLAMAQKAGPSANLTGFDLWSEGVEEARRKARELGLANVDAQRAELSDLASVPDGKLDLALMATVLHDLEERKTARASLLEAARALRKGGTLAVIEFKKIDARPGPPVHIRLSPEETASLVTECGFSAVGGHDLRPHLYLSLFRKN